MFIRMVLPGGSTRKAVGKDIIVDHQSPFPYADRFVFRHNDVACKDIAAVDEPDMRMERVVDHDIVFDYPVEAFP